MQILVRLAAAAAFALVAVPAAAAEDMRPSAIACDARKIGARELAECLHAAALKSERELTAQVDAAAKSIEGRAGLLSGQKTRWKRSLNDAEAQWLSWRDAECQDVAPFEALGGRNGDPRLQCLIDQNARRMADLKSRYP